MFEQAKKNAPCIIFIDEIDAVGRHRGAGLGGGNDEREQTLNQLLVEMDGFEANEGIILIAATNRPDVLDPALLRPGRFDRQVVVPNPDIVGRERILKVHVRNVPLAPNVDLKVLARGTPGFSGADLMNLVNEAALMAARRNKRVVTMQEFEDAKDKIMMGAERRSSAMTEAEKKLTAYHEAGHAIVALNVPVGRSAAQGDDHSARPCARHGHAAAGRRPLFDELQVDGLAPRIMMGGRVAEELTFGKENITSGASSDIEQATKLARAMVTQWGFSDQLGQVAYGENQQEVFLGHSVSQSKNVSEATAQKIDSEVRRLIDEAYTEARDPDRLPRRVRRDRRGLLEYETLTGEEIKALIAARKPRAISATIRRRAAARPCRRPARVRLPRATSPKAGLEPQPH
jgi:cell division protease FtsH